MGNWWVTFSCKSVKWCCTKVSRAKVLPTQNVLAVCSFDLKFTYVLPGWEGSASDSRILDNALMRYSDKLIIPQGDYWWLDNNLLAQVTITNNKDPLSMLLR